MASPMFRFLARKRFSTGSSWSAAVYQKSRTNIQMWEDHERQNVTTSFFPDLSYRTTHQDGAKSPLPHPHDRKMGERAQASRISGK